MTPPVSYYGGKQKMLKHILPLIPSHKIYIEPFFGGGAVFFGKNPSEVEVINDLNDYVINFYNVLKDKKKFKKLLWLIKHTIYHESEHKKAVFIAKYPDFFDDIQRAWSFFVNVNFGFSNTLNAGFGFNKSAKVSKAIYNKIKNFNYHFHERLRQVTIMNRDALDVIKRFDTENSFFYIDPPYFNSNCGHYKGYTKEDFINLLEILTQIKGKFLLSSYWSEILQKYIKKYNWNYQLFEKPLAVTHKEKYTSSKTEVLIANYKLSQGCFILKKCK